MCAAIPMVSLLPSSSVALQYRVNGETECDGEGAVIALEEPESQQQQQQQQGDWIQEEEEERGEEKEKKEENGNATITTITATNNNNNYNKPSRMEDDKSDSGGYSLREGSSPVIASRLHRMTETTAEEVMVVEGDHEDFIAVDWDKVNRETEQHILEETSSGRTGASERNKPITFLEAAESLKRDTSSWEPYIIPNRFYKRDEGNCLTALFYRLFRRPECCTSMCSRYDTDPDAITGAGGSSSSSSGFNSDAIERTLERDIDFTLTLPSVPFDNGQMIHRRLLVTVHNGLLYPTSISCGSSSTHSGAMDWEKIGFQGNDPATDLRSTGLFGLLQLVYLIEYYSAFTARLWETCNANGAEDDVFTKLPFVLIGFNFSAMLLERLRDNAFRSDFIRRARRMCATGKNSLHLRTNSINMNYLWSEFPMLLVCCEYLVGSLFLFWERWLQLQQQRGGRPPTIREFGVVKLALFSKMKSSGVQYVWDACSRARDPSAVNTLPADIPVETTVPVQTDDVVCDSMCVGAMGEEMIEQKGNEQEKEDEREKEEKQQEKEKEEEEEKGEKKKNNGLILGDTDEVKQ